MEEKAFNSSAYKYNIFSCKGFMIFILMIRILSCPKIKKELLKKLLTKILYFTVEIKYLNYK